MSYIMDHKIEIEYAAWASASSRVYTTPSSLEDDCAYPVLIIYDVIGNAYDVFVKLINRSVPSSKFLVALADKKLTENAVLLVLEGDWVYIPISEVTL